MSTSTQSAASSGPPLRAAPGAAGLAGTSFKHEHFAAILEHGLQDGFFEVHAENYMGAGGFPHHALSAIRERYPVSLHGVCMSIGGPDGLDAGHLARFGELVARYEPALVSEHLAWSSHGGTFFSDLLPLPYTRATLDQVCEHIDQVQEAIGRPMLLENPSTYVAFASSTMTETEFIRALAQRTGCGLLLDVNNVFVSATNHGYQARAYLADFPLEYVGEIHLAGHSEQHDDEHAPLLIDSHDRAVADQVWALYRDVIARTGPMPTLIEWDSQLPAWSELRAQALAARRIVCELAGKDATESDIYHPKRVGHEA
ncbi:MNIO family bufferin maturase [Paraburkholderia sp. JPY419]|uniref:MNIO family bufferin maturase n=1 Tax=Paraburkholderia sp. JPY419 TaxID=667660 RepID=UPI003D1FA2CD